MELKKGVYTVSVALQAMKIFGRQIPFLSHHHALKAEKTLLLIHFQCAGTEDFGEFTIPGASQQIHLPEAILGGDVALSKNGIIKILSENMGNANGIAYDLDRTLKPRQPGLAVDGGLSSIAKLIFIA